MIRRFGEQHFMRPAVGTILLVLAMTLASCGTLDVALEPTPNMNQAAASPASGAVQSNGTEMAPTPGETQEPTAGWGPLMSYIHPSFGYELLVPEGADFIEEDSDENIIFFSDRDLADNPSYLIGVMVLPATDQSPRELLSALSAGEIDLLDVKSVEMNSGDRSGALVSYSVEAGPACPELRPLLAAFVDQGTGYAIHIYSHGPERCDAIDVPEALTIVESFRPPANTPVLAMTPTPTPASTEELIVVFTRDNNAWLWTEDGGERQLTKDGGVDQVLLSDDKSIIAFRRGNGIWAINADGTDERQLVKESDLPIPQEGELAGYINGMTINQLAWIPGSHQLLFNTRMLSDGPGLLLSDDLWRVNTDPQSVLSLDYLFLPGEGGNFVIAPDGNRVAVITPDSVSLTNINGEDKQRIFGYTPVSTYSEVSYYARPVWSPSSDVLGVVIPPPDPLGMENQAFGIWRLRTDGGSAGLVGTIEASGTNPLPDPVINPTLETIAYVSSPEVDLERTDLLFVTWGDTISEPTFYTSRVDSFYDWSPGGERFSFARPPGDTPSETPGELAAVSTFIGQLDEEPRFVGNGESVAMNVHWVDDDSYLYLQSSARGWDLLLSDISGNVTPIAAVVGQPPAFDAGS